jgi:hypothetical protein
MILADDHFRRTHTDRHGRTATRHRLAIHGFSSLVRVATLLALLGVTVVGCRTATTPGSAYRQTGRIVDLLAEPTYDIGGAPNGSQFYSTRVPHNNADGHGLFDVPIVFVEQLTFAPFWVTSAATRLIGIDPYLLSQFYPGSNPNVVATTYALARRTAGWALAAPSAITYAFGLTATMAIDTVAHDVPVIVFGAPARIWRALQ